MSSKELSLAIEYMTRMNNKFEWRECTTTERLQLLDGTPLPERVYKLINVKATKKGITFICWFSDEEVMEVMVNKFACDAYDVTDVWRDLIG